MHGHPDVRQVTILDLDPSNGHIRRRHFVYDLSTGTVGDMGENEVQTAAAHRVTEGSASTAA